MISSILLKMKTGIHYVVILMPVIYRRLQPEDLQDRLLVCIPYRKQKNNEIVSLCYGYDILF